MSSGRLGLIALSLVALAVPAQAACVALGDSMGDCHYAALRAAESHAVDAHRMDHCGDETSVSAGCCGTSLGERGDDLVLKRRGDEHEIAVEVAWTEVASVLRTAEVPARADALPLRPPRYELFAALLL